MEIIKLKRKFRLRMSHYNYILSYNRFLSNRIAYIKITNSVTLVIDSIFDMEETIYHNKEAAENLKKELSNINNYLYKLRHNK